MKGWPLLRAFVALLALLLAGLPLRRLTAPPAPEKPHFKLAVAPEIRTIKPETVTIELAFTLPPQSFSLEYSGKELIHDEGGKDFEYHKDVEMPFPPEGIDLVLKADWEEHFRKNGVRIRVVRPDGWAGSRTVWGKKSMEEVLTFPGKESKPTP